MISLTPMTTADDRHSFKAADLDLYLARAQQESIASLRAVDPRAAASHCTMAAHYSAKAVALLEARA
jgi:hypothetical protein